MNENGHHLRSFRVSVALPSVKEAGGPISVLALSAVANDRWLPGYTLRSRSERRHLTG